MQATSTRDPIYGVSSLAPDNERAEFCRLAKAGNHDEVRRRLAEAAEGMSRRIWLRRLEARASATT